MSLLESVVLADYIHLYTNFSIANDKIFVKIFPIQKTNTT